MAAMIRRQVVAPVGITGERELVSSSGAFLDRLAAVAALDGDLRAPTFQYRSGNRIAGFYGGESTMASVLADIERNIRPRITTIPKTDMATSGDYIVEAVWGWSRGEHALVYSIPPRKPGGRRNRKRI